MSGPVSCPGKLHQPRNLQFSNIVFLWDFLNQFTRCFLYPFGRNLRLYRTSGMSSLMASMGGVESLRLLNIRRGKRLANSRPPAELQGETHHRRKFGNLHYDFFDLR